MRFKIILLVTSLMYCCFCNANILKIDVINKTNSRCYLKSHEVKHGFGFMSYSDPEKNTISSQLFYFQCKGAEVNITVSCNGKEFTLSSLHDPFYFLVNPGEIYGKVISQHPGFDITYNSDLTFFMGNVGGALNWVVKNR